jgi:CO/xanthine dehydrogenase FAD-binding subunit
MQLRFDADGSLLIGGATPCAEIYDNAEVASRLPGLVDAASLIGGIQVQSRASLGGNLCNASPAADSAAALIALDARLTIVSNTGQREIPAQEIFGGPGRNTLQPGELLLQVRIPAQPKNSGAFYMRFIPRNEMDIAVASAGVRLELDDSRQNIVAARIAISAVAPTPLRVPAAEAALAGQPATSETFARAAEAAAEAATPITDMRGSIAQRKQLARVLTNRALNGALARAKESR